MPRPYLIGHVITLLTSFLLLYGGQAHLTDRYTPALANGVERMAEVVADAWGLLGLMGGQVGLTRSSLALSFDSPAGCRWCKLITRYPR